VDAFQTRATGQTVDIDTANRVHRQDSALQSRVLLPPSLSCDDFDITNRPQRRNSAPSSAMSAPSHDFVWRRYRSASLDQLLNEEQVETTYRGLLTQVPALPLESPPSTSALPIHHSLTMEDPAVETSKVATPAMETPAVESIRQCLICCTEFKEYSEYTTPIIQPCRSCDSDYCSTCLRQMFIDACSDMTRMPPRCHVPLNLRQVRALLTDEEIALFKAKYEEWSTRHPVYCPAPQCSVFIPGRLLPQQMKKKGNQRVDSGVGTPTTLTFACPTCEVRICEACRQFDHPGLNCKLTEFGIDAETAVMLKSWGYKQCPNCNHGLKRMYGCNHVCYVTLWYSPPADTLQIQCRCGAHFCWVCLKSDCDENCYENDDEEYGSDAESDGSNDEELAIAVNDGITGATAEATQQEANHDSNTTAIAQAIPRPRNLDGGGGHHWEAEGLDFGEEPEDGPEGRSWDCHHAFSPYKIQFAAALTNSEINELECVQCWKVIHPEIELPEPIQIEEKEKTVSTSTLRQRGSGRILTHGRQRQYEPPRGLSRDDATIGTAPHLSTTMSQSSPERATSPMEDVQYSHQITNTYSNLITATPLVPRRPVSLDADLGAILQSTSTSKLPLRPFKSTSQVFSSTTITLSFAHECQFCSMLVCETCKADTLAAQGDDADEHDVDFEAKPSIATETAAENAGNESDDDDDDDDNDLLARASLFD
jgi:hypothetical protein